MSFFSHVYSPRQGQTTHWGQKFYDNRKAFSLCPYVANFKMISSKTDFKHIFNDFIHVYSHRAKVYNPLGDQLLMSTGSPYHFAHSFQIKKKMSLKSDFIYIFFMFHHYVYSPRQGQTIHWGQNFDDNRKTFSLCPYVASFKMVSSKSDFMHILNDFIHVYRHGARGRNPLETNF